GLACGSLCCTIRIGCVVDCLGGQWRVKPRKMLPGILTLVVAGWANVAFASLVFDGVASGKGAGIGTSNVVLTIQNTPSEQGCVGWNGTADVVGSAACPGGLSPAITGGNEKTGNSQTQTRTVAQTGVTSASNLVLVLNVSEPGGSLITVDNVSLTIYS